MKNKTTTRPTPANPEITKEQLARLRSARAGALEFVKELDAKPAGPGWLSVKL